MDFFIFILGLIAGGFANTYIYFYQIHHNKSSPGTSSLFKGKCRKLSKGLGQIVLIELICATLYLMAFCKFGLTFKFLSSIILLTVLVITAFIDMEFQIIPDNIVLPAAAAGILLHAFLGKEIFLYHLAGFAVGFGVIFLIAFFAKGGMGGGDVKLFGMVGLFLGARLTILALILSFILGSVISLILIVLKIKSIKDVIPFGPFIALASAISLFFGDKIILWFVLNKIF